MERTTRRTRLRPSVRPTVEVLQLAPRPRLPFRTVPNGATPPPELDQLAAIARELGRWWV